MDRPKGPTPIILVSIMVLVRETLNRLKVKFSEDILVLFYHVPDSTYFKWNNRKFKKTVLSQPGRHRAHGIAT